MHFIDTLCWQELIKCLLIILKIFMLPPIHQHRRHYVSRVFMRPFMSPEQTLLSQNLVFVDRIRHMSVEA